MKYLLTGNFPLLCNLGVMGLFLLALVLQFLSFVVHSWPVPNNYW